MAPVPIEVVYVEPVYCPQAVLDWYASGSREKKKEIMANRNVKSSEISLQAKQHLSAAGWEIAYVEKRGKVPELRYKSPKGRSYHSLRMACLECIQDLGLHSKDMTAKIDQNLMQGIVKQDGLDGAFLGSRKRRNPSDQDVNTWKPEKGMQGIVKQDGLDGAFLGSRKRRNPSDQDVNTWKPEKGKVTVAAEYCHNVVVPSHQNPQSIPSLLIDKKDQDVNTWKPEKGKVTVAAESGHNVIVPSLQNPQSIPCLLIDKKDQDVNTGKPEKGKVTVAAESGHNVIVPSLQNPQSIPCLLIDKKDQDVNTWKPEKAKVTVAAEYGHNVIVHSLQNPQSIPCLLIDKKDQDVNTWKPEKGKFTVAAEYGHNLIVPSLQNPQSILLDKKDQDVNTWKPEKGKVTVAAEYGHNVIVHSLQNPQSIPSLLIDKKVVLPNAMVLCIREKDQRQLKLGKLSRDGIICTCCQQVLTLSGFEAHAGKTYGGPAASIVLEDGRTLLECQRQLSLKLSSPKESYDCISFAGCSVDSEVTSEDQIGESEVEQFQPTEEWCKKNCPDFLTDDLLKLNATVKLEKEEKSEELMEFLLPDLKDESLIDLDIEVKNFGKSSMNIRQIDYNLLYCKRNDNNYW